MKISFFKPKDYDGNVKATIHTSGKMGFTDAAIKKIGINERKGIKIGRNENDEADKNLYVLFNDELDEETFKIYKAGSYFYVNTKALFDTMQIPYKQKRIIYDIIESHIEGVKMYKFIYREKTKKET